jgi:hypothetical protein
VISRVSTLWFERAALSARKLLAENPIPSTSLLDGDYFLGEVKPLLAAEGALVGEKSSEVPTVSLLVTATALPIAETPDEVPRPVRDSRRSTALLRPEVPPGILDMPELPPVPGTNEFSDIDTLALPAGLRRHSRWPSSRWRKQLN